MAFGFAIALQVPTIVSATETVPLPDVEFSPELISVSTNGVTTEVGKWYLRFDTVPGWKYTVEESQDMQNWTISQGGLFYGNGNGMRCYVCDGPMPAPESTGSGTGSSNSNSYIWQIKSPTLHLEMQADGASQTHRLRRNAYTPSGQTSEVPAWDAHIVESFPAQPMGTRYFGFLDWNDATTRTMYWTTVMVTITDQPVPADSFPPTTEEPEELAVFEHIKPALIARLLSADVPPVPYVPSPRKFARVRVTELFSGVSGVPDWWQVQYGYGPFALSGQPGYFNPDGDDDSDGLSNKQEHAAGTNPNSSDSDGDGALDGEEVAEGYDPKNSNSYPPRYIMVTNGANYYYDGNAHGSPPAGSYVAFASWVPGTTYSVDPGFIAFPNFSTKLEEVAPLPFTLPSLYTPAPSSISVGGEASYYPHYGHYANLQHPAVWLRVSPAPTQEIRRKMLRVQSRSFSTTPWIHVIESIDTVEFVIPATTIAPPIPATPVNSLGEHVTPSFTNNPPDANAIHSEETEEVLFPLRLTIHKLNEQPSLDGMLAKVGDTLVYQLASNTNSFPLSPSAVTWSYRQLRGDGILDVWKNFGSVGPRIENIESVAGIFQIKATINIGHGSTPIEVQYQRRRDDPYGKNSAGTMNPLYKAGEPDYVGIAAGEPQLRLAQEARSVKGSTSWATSASIALTTSITAPPGANKCNVFNYHMAIRSGATVGLDSGGWPPRAYDWYDEDKTIAGWTWRSETEWAEPGIIISRYLDGESTANLFDWGFRWYTTSAHCGILDYDGAWINAGSANVNRYPHLMNSGYQTAYTRKN